MPPQFSGDLFFSRHLSKRPSFPRSRSSCVYVYGPFTYSFLVWPYLYDNVYGLLLLIGPLSGPLYTVIKPFYPHGPPSRGSSGVVCASPKSLSRSPTIIPCIPKLIWHICLTKEHPTSLSQSPYDSVGRPPWDTCLISGKQISVTWDRPTDGKFG